MKKLFQLGFTLIELLIVVLIIGIIAAIGMPAYQNYVDDSRRKEGTAALLALASAQERYYTANNSYASTVALINPALATSQTGLYTLSTAYQQDGNGDDLRSTYTLTADPVNADALCDNLTLTNTGVRGENGAGDLDDCWE